MEEVIKIVLQTDIPVAVKILIAAFGAGLAAYLDHKKKQKESEKNKEEDKK